MLRFYQVAWNPIAKVATVQFKGAAAPVNNTVLGYFQHDGEVYPDGFHENHVLYHEARDVLYPFGIEDMQSVSIEKTGTFVAATSKSITPAGPVAKGASVNLTLTVAPAGATYKTAKWGTTTPLLAWVSPEGKLTGLAAGTAKVYAMPDDNGIQLLADVVISA